MQVNICNYSPRYCHMTHTGQQDNEVKRVYWKKGKCTRFKGLKIFHSGLATTYGKNRRGNWGYIWPMGNESCFWPFLSAGAFVSGLSIRRCFLPAKETLTSWCELKGKRCQRFQIRFCLSLFRRFRRWFQRPQIKFLFCCKTRNNYSGIVAGSV